MIPLSDTISSGTFRWGWFPVEIIRFLQGQQFITHIRSETILVGITYKDSCVTIFIVIYLQSRLTILV